MVTWKKLKLLYDMGGFQSSLLFVSNLQQPHLHLQLALVTPFLAIKFSTWFFANMSAINFVSTQFAEKQRGTPYIHGNQSQFIHPRKRPYLSLATDICAMLCFLCPMSFTFSLFNFLLFALFF